jgi:Cytochrome c554 and c-prime
MPNSNRWYWAVPCLVALTVLLGWIIVSRQRRDATTSNPPVRAASRISTTPLAGTPSCSARGCHGSIEPDLDQDHCQQNEYTYWLRDPHADAYRTLLSERSQAIIRILGGGKKAHEDARCLACHANPQLAALESSSEFVQQERLFGVGCESCHGNATSWLTAHTAPDWQQKKSAHTMPDLTDPTVTARKCVGCHVGAPPDRDYPLRDVNHDMIAAGHPRLNFEFDSYLANMPAHWRARPTSDGKLWSVGQVVSAQAALDLLAHRAEAGPWPEFAEYDCYACHHSLTSPSWRQNARHNARPGSLPWGTWYFAMPRELAGDPRALADLQRHMQFPSPARAEAATKAKAARASLDLLLPRANETLARQRVVDRFAKGEMKLEPSWDAAEQMYLALLALRPSPSLDALARERAYAPATASPLSAFEPSQFLQKLRAAVR